MDQVSEAVQLELKALPSSPLLLDAVGFCDVEQAFGNHRDDKVLRREDTKGCIGAACMRDGEAIEPAVEWLDYPVLLDMPAARLRGYARETVVAEKFQAMVDLGTIVNRRLTW